MTIPQNSVRELTGTIAPGEALDAINRFGGFPEPFLSRSEEEAARWRSQYFTDLRTKEGREVDFTLTEGDKVSVLVEAKTSEPEPSPSLVYFKERIDGINAVQLVWNLRKETHRRGVDIVRAAEWLSKLEA